MAEMLHAAARDGQLEATQQLLKDGANCDHCDADGRTPLDLATEHGHERVADLLRGQRFAPLVLRGLLDGEQIEGLLRLRDELAPMWIPIHDAGKGHTILYLHAGQAAGRGVLYRSECAELLQGLVGRMRSSDPRASLAPGELARDLSVRCVELHRYGVGGSLMARDHRDTGSSLSMSVLLSEPSTVGGGEFVTWEAGRRRDAWDEGDEPVEHRLSRGDALLFRSEDLHNVTPVTSGVRQSLVIELWAKQPTDVDRYR